MQTIQSARLTSKPQLTLPINSSYSHNGYDPPAPRPVPVRASGILRHRPAYVPVDDNHHLDSDPRTVELLARFLASTGIPLEASQDPSFLDLIKHLNRDCVLPAVNVMSKFLEKCTTNPKPLVNYQKTVGPLSVTLDTETQGDQSFLVFSIHYFEDLYERKNIVYLRKLHLGEIYSETLLVACRRAVNNFSYQSVRFSNIVLPNERIFEEIRHSPVVKRSFVCFYNYMSDFVRELLTIPELKNGLAELRGFVQYIRKDMDSYGKFRRMQLTKNAELDVPKLDKASTWESTAMFLTRCLVLHDTFTEYCERFSIAMYISNTTFTHLVFFQRVLQQCIKHCRNLSQPDNSISQIIPAVNELRNHLSSIDMNYRFHGSVVDALNQSFKFVITGPNRTIYELASFLDPRYGHRDLGKSVELENRVIDDFVHAEPGLERSFFSDISLMHRDERISTIKQELMSYRKVVHVQRPEENESPFIWWGRRQTDMEFLAVISREYLATPATSISARAYFSDSGKFHHLCETYSYTQLENFLFTAGIHQKYTGRGWCNEIITQEMLETLNSTERRIQKHVNYNNYAPGCSAEQREEILGAAYPPVPVFGQDMMDEVKEEPLPRSSIPPHRRPIVPGLRPQPPPMRTVQVRPLPPNMTKVVRPGAGTPGRLIPDQVKIVQHRNFLKSGSPNWRVPTPSSGQPMGEEKPPELIPEQEIKEELIDEDGAPQLVQAGQKTNTPMPQNIQPHNFVQKFTQKQNFFRRTPLPPPISIRDPMPVTNSRFRFQKLTESHQQPEEVKPETIEQKQEGYEELERSVDHRKVLPRRSFDSMRAAQNQRLAGMTVERCYEEHRNNQEALRRLPCNRRCQVCGHLTRHESLKNVTIDNEKLLLMLGCVYRGEFNLAAAREFMDRVSKTYVCHVHFEETLDEVYSMLHLSSPDEIQCCSNDLLHNTLITVTQLRSHITGQQLRKILYDFANKNNHLRLNRSNLMDAYEPLPPPIPQSLPNDVDDDDIIPKNQRQPRKQVLEDDDTDGGTIKMIAQEDFKLPEAKPSDNEQCDNPGTCCYCSRVGSRHGMHKIPRSEDRLARWIEKLGPKFEERLKSGEENLICRSHFPEEAFSSRGRLLKGMIPEAEPEKYEVTYKIQGDQFEKVDEQRTGMSCPLIGVPVDKTPYVPRKVGRPRGSYKKKGAKKTVKARAGVRGREPSTDESVASEGLEGSEEGFEAYEELAEVKQEEVMEYDRYGHSFGGDLLKEPKEEEEEEEEMQEEGDDYDYDPDQPSTSSALHMARRAVKRHVVDDPDDSTMVRKSRRQAARREASSQSMSDEESEDPYASRAKIARGFMKQHLGK